MPLASHAFLLLFLPAALFIYYKLVKNGRGKLLALLLFSGLFYAAAGWQYLPLLLGLSLVTYFAARRGWTGWGIVLNFAGLVLFKYWDFGLENINWLSASLGLTWSAKLLSLALPLGISFYIFKHVGYLLDVRNGRFEAGQDLLLFLTYSSFFPQVSAGPISGYKETAAQLSALPDRLDNSRIYAGLVFISMGLAKKALVADSLGTLLASEVNSIQGFSGLLPAWYLVIAYAMQLYFDFSGYTDMALGVGMLFGVSLPPNFNAPYLAQDPADFWNRWHISLSTWFRNYLFFPISRGLLRRWGQDRREQAQFVSNFATMSLVGLWHGAGWGFILWGFYHGLLLNLHAWWKRSGRSMPPAVARILFLFGLMLGWGLFMSPNMEYLSHLFAQLIGLNGLGSLEALNALFVNPATLVLVFALPLAFSGQAEAAVGQTDQQRVWVGLLWGILAALGLLFLRKDIQFLYVQF